MWASGLNVLLLLEKICRLLRVRTFERNNLDYGSCKLVVLLRIHLRCSHRTVLRIYIQVPRTKGVCWVVVFPKQCCLSYTYIRPSVNRDSSEIHNQSFTSAESSRHQGRGVPSIEGNQLKSSSLQLTLPPSFFFFMERIDHVLLILL